MRKILLKNTGDYAIVDPDRFNDLSQYSWHCRKSGKNKYAARNYFDKELNKWKTHYMHWSVLPQWETTRSIVVDHKNGKGLDNRRKNLQYLRQSDNVRGVHRI